MQTIEQLGGPFRAVEPNEFEEHVARMKAELKQKFPDLNNVAGSGPQVGVRLNKEMVEDLTFLSNYHSVSMEHLIGEAVKNFIDEEIINISQTLKYVSEMQM
jgi:hypothetical protein